MRIFLGIFFVITLLNANIFAQKQKPSLGGLGAPDFYTSDLFDELWNTLPSYNEVTARTHDASDICKQTYKNLYEDNIIRFDIFFGYANYSGIVCDNFQKTQFTKHLTTNCTPGYYACGFVQTSNRPVTLEKIILGPNNNFKKIIITAKHSSVSDQDKWNKTIFYRRQKKQSRKIMRQFRKSLDSAHVVIYKGHSRHGKGPGFYPLYPKYYFIDYLEQNIIKIGKRKLKRTIKNNKGNLKLLAYLACKTEKHYKNILTNSSKPFALILSKINTKAKETSLALVSSIDSLIGMKCENDFSNSLNSYRLERPEQFKDEGLIVKNLNSYDFFK